ncbi:uncharacterized protein [Temnothorax longispinosus]|uniref:uncharacterized protein n=1 Tax=Temnothorax longispinosus TaxID=300112 RepID=UPI003A99BF61
MPRRKVERSKEEEEEFQRQRRKRKVQNQYNRRQIAKKAINKNNVVVNEISDTNSIANTSSVSNVIQDVTYTEYQSDTNSIANTSSVSNVIQDVTYTEYQSDTNCIAGTSSVDQVIQRITRAEHQSRYRLHSNESIDYRLNDNSNLDLEIVQNLEHIMREYNVFAQSYQMMGEELENQRQLESNQLELQLFFNLRPETDRRRYNAQRTNEVAAVFVTTADGEIPESYVVVRNKNTKTLQNISIMNPNVEPWIYPLFYPYGTQGWHCHLKKLNSDKRISRGQYVKYRITIRDDFNILLLGRRLFQQWLVDNYVRIERDRTEYCKTHQKELRFETYQGLIDYMQNIVNNLNGRIGKMVILPSTFIGSPRNMFQNYQDAMTIM